MDRRSRHQVKPDPRTPSALWLPNDRPNDIVAPIHPKPMPVILTTEEECEVWMRASGNEACRLQRPLSDGVLKIVASEEREDPPPQDVQRSKMSVDPTERQRRATATTSRFPETPLEVLTART